LLHDITLFGYEQSPAGISAGFYFLPLMFPFYPCPIVIILEDKSACMTRLIAALFLLIPFLAAGNDTAADSTWFREHYTKKEIYIPMRDGVRLFTIVYAPRDNAAQHPILLNRTPYSVAPYGADTMRTLWLTHWMMYCREGYIIVMQDVRGRMMSEGEFMDVRPFIENKKTKKQTDEASDTYDTIDWLVKNIKGNNGRVGAFGISYPGFYTTMAALSGHPALKAVSPQAPVTDWFAGDDFHHNGAFMEMDAFNFYTIFGPPRPAPVKTFPEPFRYYTKDNYKFYLENDLTQLARFMGDSIAFWKDVYAHPDYDAWWQARNTRNYVQHIPAKTATLVVGGLLDAEDCFGAFNLYKAIEQKAHNDNKLVIGPWAHGYWARDEGSYLGNIRFGSKTSEWYQQHIEVPYFNYYLKGKGNIDDIKEANIFFTGSNEWHTFDKWPPANEQEQAIYLQPSGALSFAAPAVNNAFSAYTSDPFKPVPYTEDVHFKRTREYMTDDQRFAARRPDVLVFQTDVLTEDLQLAGPVVADLFTAISTTDADFVVKLIDVFPDDFAYPDDMKGNGMNYPMGGYQELVRGEIMRGRYRNSLEKPEAFVPGQVTEVKYTLPDVAHVFQKGHRLMIQVQSTWFPVADRNPQQFINIYQAQQKDFVRSDIRIYHDAQHASKIVLPVLKP
jgi:putative CocE/NonD family hydrolase